MEIPAQAALESYQTEAQRLLERVIAQQAQIAVMKPEVEKVGFLEEENARLHDRLADIQGPGPDDKDDPVVVPFPGGDQGE